MQKSAASLIIFGCGYVGSEVARQAVRRGMRVIALTRNASKAEALRTEGIGAVIADLSGDDWHAEIPASADYVLNSVSSGGGGVEGYRRSYVDGMNSILRWARGSSSLGTLVYTSSTSVYPQDGGVRVEETAPTEPSSETAAVLLEAERLTREAEAEKGGFRRSFILRLAGIYGPGRHHVLDQVRTGKVAGRAEHRLNLAHRDDIVAAIWAAFNAPPSVLGGTFNVADDGPARKQEVANWLADYVQVPSPEFTGAPAGGRRAVTPDRIIDNSRLKSLLGWRPQFPTFREGYKNMLPLRSD